MRKNWTRLLVGSAMLPFMVAFGAGPAAAQTAPADATTAQDPSAAEDNSADATNSTAEASEDSSSSKTIVVTGSRIPRTSADNPTPTTILTSETIEQSGVTEIADLVNEIPSLFITQNNQTSNNNGFPGLNALNLRGLGIERTLVLVNGRRRVPAWPGTAAVDVSAIPTGLIDRVEVITGGASALYGADAVAGVVNLILKKDFEGLQATAQYGNSTRGDLKNYYVDVLYGTNFAGGRGNVTLFGSYTNSPDEVYGQDRPWTDSGTPLYIRPAPGEKFEIVDNNRSVYNHDAAIVELGGKGNLFTFNPDGSMRVAATPADILNIASSTSNMSNYRTHSDEFFGRFDNYLLTTPSNRISTFGTVSYDLTDNVRAFADLEYSRTHSNSAYAPYSVYGLAGTVVPGEQPVHHAPQIIAANGGPISAGGLIFARRFSELGLVRTYYQRSTVQADVGLDGTIPRFLGHEWKWNLSYTFGQTRQEFETHNATANNRFYSALDSGGTTANPICNDPAAVAEGCVPLNPFMPLTQGVIDYLQYDTSPAVQKIQQHVLTGYMTGTVFSLPAGPVQAVVGGEYRAEKTVAGVTPEYDPDDPLFDPSLGITSTPLTGKFHVTEVFGELRVPLLKDVPLFHSLEVEGAARLSDYSTAGRTNSWKVGGEWAPIQDIRFRGTYGQAVRAPNISELFTSSSISSNYYRDPCNYYDVLNRANITEFTGPNCAMLNPANRNDPGSYWQYIPVTTEGNPDLDVETARTLTLGGVLRPRFLPRFTLSVDYFDIRLKGAIGSFDAQTILEKCVDAPDLNNQFCALVARDPATNNLLGVTTSNLNLSEFRTKGVDVEATFQQDLSALGLGANAGSLSINAALTRLLSRTFTLDPTNQDTKSETVGVYGSPKWKAAVRTTYNNGPLTLNWTMRYFSGMRQSTAVTPETHVQVYSPDTFYHDFYASYDLWKRLTLYGGLRNAFDTAPPRFPGAESGGANFENGTQAGLWDTIGRTFYVGARVRY